MTPPGAPTAAVDRLPRRLLASWQRSEEYGVPLDTVEPVFSGTTDTDSLFFRCGLEVLTGLARSLTAEPVSLMLTDADGRVLDRRSGDQSLLRSLDAVHLAPGFSYAERATGTNGLGLALADRAATVVRAEEHYALSLCGYTCAAAPVIDPESGRLEGAVNLTTWSRSSSELLLALVQSAASNTAALMLARSTGREPRPLPRGEVFRVEAPRLEPGGGSLTDLSPGWTRARGRVVAALEAGHRVLAVGESGSGRSTLLAQAHRVRAPFSRILAVNPPDPEDVDTWLSLWGPEIAKPHTAVVVRGVDRLPLRAADRLRELLLGPGVRAPVSLTAERVADIPAALATLADVVVSVPALRDRPNDVLPLARHLASRIRHREVDFAPPAERALLDHGWPGNVRELARVVRSAAEHTDCITMSDLPPGLTAGRGHRLSRIEAFERDEIVRVLAVDGITMADAAAQLGISRATLYRKITHYGVHR